jgi:hypothetical protein
LAICPNCQAQVPDSARFCQECGARMPSQEALVSSAPSEPKAPAREILTPDTPTIVDLSNPVQAETQAQPSADSNEPEEKIEAESEHVAAQPETPAEPAAPQETSQASFNTVLLPEVSAEELEKQRAALEAKQQAEQPSSPQATVVLPRVEVPEPPAAAPASPHATVVLPRVEVPEPPPFAPASPHATVLLPREPQSDEAKSSSEPSLASDTSAGSADQTSTVVPSAPAGPSESSSPYGTPPAGTPPRYDMPPSGTAPYGTPPSGTAPYSTPPTGTGSLYGTPPSGTPPVQSSYGAPAEQPASSNKQLYWIIGGIGCLIFFLLVMCAIFAFVVLANGLGQNQSSPSPAAQVPTRVRDVTQGPRPTLDPSLSGRILLQDRFDSPEDSSLQVGSDGERVYAFEDGAYAINVLVPRLIAWSGFEREFSDVYVEVESTLVEGPESAAASLIFRSQGLSDQDNGNFYVYNVTSDGRYNLELMRNNALETLIDWTPSAEINPRGEANTLGLQLQGDRISLYVNNVLLEEYSDATFTDGKIALAVNTFDEGGAKVLFDNFVVEAE